MWHCGYHSHNSQGAADSCERNRLRYENTKFREALIEITKPVVMTDDPRDLGREFARRLTVAQRALRTEAETI